MESDTNLDTAGLYFQAFRLKKGFSLSEVSRMTRITVDYLAALEADNYDSLPSRAYVKSFIRSYARVLEINPDIVINLYLADLDRKDRAYRKRWKRQANLWAIRKVLVTIGFITSFLLLIRYADILSLPQPSESPEDAPPALRPFVIDQNATPPPPFSPPVSEKRQVLKVVAVEPTWLKVMIDEQDTHSYTFKPEDQLELEGKRNFNLMVGSATGLRISLNGKPVELYGATGQLVSLKVP